jgi:predicted ferric reductase
LLVAGYVAAICAPLLVALLLDGGADASLARKLGRACALLALPILAFQPVLAARLRLLDRAFGLDNVYLFHKIMAMVAGSLLIAHPLVLASGGRPPWSLLTSFAWPWYINLAKVALVALLVTIGTSLLYRELHLRYERWRELHNALAVLVVSIAFVHSLSVGTDLQHWAMRGIWFILAAVAAVSYGFHKIVWPRCRERRPFRIAQVERESHNAWTLRIAPPEGAQPFTYLPGQFQFLTFLDSKGLPREEHPFTISSSPTSAGYHAATIKESGDFTALIGGVRAGDRIGVQGPFGHFSYALHPQERELVFIAGGVGITPFMAMLRHMLDSGADVSVVLICANRHERDILFRQELDDIAAGARPQLKVVHVLSAPERDWTGEKGHVDVPMIRRHVASLGPDKTFYICGPPGMTAALIGDLVRAGVRSAKIRTERFDL